MLILLAKCSVILSATEIRGNQLDWVGSYPVAWKQQELRKISAEEGGKIYLERNNVELIKTNYV